MGSVSWSYVTQPAAFTAGAVGHAELAIDPLTGDLALPARIVRGPDAIIQRLSARLRFFLGEWFLDRRLGVPYYRDVLVKNPSIPLVTSVFRRVVAGTPGIDRVHSFTARLDASRRELTASFEALAEDQTVKISAVDSTFLIG